jgi:two-component system chemotaxis sensor kinase CheA
LITESDRLTDEGIHRLIFEAGFSTAEDVTETSGRGVGMDVVRRNVEALRGSISVHSVKGEGTRLTIRLPLTLAIIEGFAVTVGSETFIVPLESVVECIELPAGQVCDEHDTGVMVVRGEALPYVRLRRHFGLDRAREGEREFVAVVQHGGSRAGLAVDALLGEMQTVIKPLVRPIDTVGGLSGCAILGTGRVALILDVPAVIEDVIRRRAEADEALAAETGRHSDRDYKRS